MQLAFWKEFRTPDSAQWSHNLFWTGLISVFVGSFITLFIRQSLKRQPYLIIDMEGLRVPSIGIPLIPWRDVRDIRRRGDLWGHSYIDLFLRAEDAYVQRLTGWRHRQANLTRKLGDPVFSFIITSLDVPAEQIYQTIQRHLSSSNGQA
jgi:hypothetical protein